MKLLRKIHPSEFSKYIVASNSAFVSGREYFLQPRVGMVSFNFGPEAIRSVFKFRRGAGNGLVLLSSGIGRPREVQISSMSGQDVACDLNNGTIQMNRTIRSRGDLSILEVAVYKHKVDWNSEVKKSEEYACLRVIDDELFASEGGFIRGEVNEIQTDPPGAFVREANKIRFIASCQVNKLNITPTNKTQITLSKELDQTRHLELDNQLKEPKAKHPDPSPAPVFEPPKPIVFSNNTQDEEIRRAFLQFAILKKDDSEIPNKIPKTGTVELTDFESRIWYGRVRNCFTDLEYTQNNIKAYHNDTPSTRPAQIQIGSIGSITKEVVFLHPMDSSYKISDANVSVLSKCTKILTPSISDMFKIKERVPNANISISYLPWPLVSADYSTQEYYLYFEEDRELTEKLISVWNASKGPLYIVGSTRASTAWVKNISFGTKYSDLVKYIIQAKGLVYLSTNTQHYSGTLELAKAHNVNIVSNNHQYTNDILIRNDQGGMQANDIKRALDTFFNKEPGIINVLESGYLEKTMAQIDKLLGGN